MPRTHPNVVTRKDLDRLSTGLVYWTSRLDDSADLDSLSTGVVYWSRRRLP